MLANARMITEAGEEKEEKKKSCGDGRKTQDI